MRRLNSAALYILLTFASGIAVGAVGHWLYSSKAVRADSNRSDEFRKRYLEGMRTRLNLSPDQFEKLGPILDTTRSLYRELHEKHRPEYQAIHQLQVAQINRLLSDTQKAEYEKFRAEQEQRRRSSHR
jgi:hypothetical protein